MTDSFPDKTETGHESEEASENGSELFEHRNPFEFMKIDDNQFLNEIDGRTACPKCLKSRKFFCYNCYVPTGIEGRYPKVKLPVQIDIIKHKQEIDGKSTAIHAAILAPDNVNIYTYPDIPEYNSNAQDGTILIFPTHNSIHVDGIFDGHVRLENVDDIKLPPGFNQTVLLKRRLNEIADNEEESHERINFKYTLDNLPIKKAVFIDSTWHQCKSIFKDPRINSMRTVVLQNRLSQFWRHQRGSPRWFLATIEAIHQFLLEVHINAWGLDRSYQALGPLEVQTDFIRNEMIFETNQQIDSEMDDKSSILCPYNGQYDNLFFFFTHMYHLIHSFYDHNALMAYRRPVL
ncbi:tRNA-uridine aminocarboxypropyltransferase 1 [Sitodiplosis mosellana]|uniref:tRNA-uridine aminocarboxypropyltransferase 1 n=1 Tax=Sitodiplosis mosellana TaxID=263140 RepID=UPI002443FD38|nr:tRNA-uridine aminocarboxypropyltransferase 1 [Sitodiplosis mosellana]